MVLVECWHRVAGTVFEPRSEDGDDVVETVRDAYFERAGITGDPDELRPCLPSMAATLGDRLDRSGPAAVIATAVTRSNPARETATPLTTALDTLEHGGSIETASRSPGSVDLDGGVRSIVVRRFGYALSPYDRRLSVLPFTLELSRHAADRLPPSVAVTAADDGWKLTVRPGDTGSQGGVVNAPIEEET